MNTLTIQELENINGGTDSFATDLGQFVGGFAAGCCEWGGIYKGLLYGIISASE